MTVEVLADGLLTITTSPVNHKEQYKPDRRLPIENRLFERVPAFSPPINGEAYVLNFKVGVAQYLNAGFLYATFGQVATRRLGMQKYLKLTKDSVPNSVKISGLKKKNSDEFRGGMIKEHTDWLLTTAGFEDQKTYELLVSEDIDDLDSTLEIMFWIKEIADTKCGFTVSSNASEKRKLEIAETLARRTLERTDITEYKTLVKKLTDQAMAKHGTRIGNQHLATHPDRTVDHILSQDDGYKNGIPAELIACPANLQWLTRADNSSKNARSDQTLNQLKTRAITEGYYDFDGIENLLR